MAVCKYSVFPCSVLYVVHSFNFQIILFMLISSMYIFSVYIFMYAVHATADLCEAYVMNGM